MSRCVVRLSLFLVALAVPLIACGDRRSQALLPTGVVTPAPAHRVVYLVVDGSGGRLMEVPSSGGRPSQIARLPMVDQTFSVDPAGRRAVLVTDLTDAPQVLLVDLSSGDVTAVGGGEGGDRSAVLGPDGKIAFCDAVGQLRVASLEYIAAAAVVYRDPIHCPPVAWRSDGALAFVAESPLGAQLADTEALYVREADGSMTTIELPGIEGYGDVDWSSDGDHVVFAAKARLALMDVASRQFEQLGSGDQARFAPGSADRLAAVRWDEQLKAVQVWEKGGVIASLPGNYAGIAWCPGGDLLAIAAPDAVWLWNWRSGEKKLLASANVSAGYPLIGASVACM